MTYLYICKNCKEEKEVEHSMKDNPEVKCDKCGEKMYRKITGGSGVLFKGSGYTKRSIT